MGIITRLLHRSDGLEKNRYNVFFMDMGENIHIHYRDLRIELSVDEFLEFADLCETYFPLVRKEIDAGFVDGLNPNTNQSDTIKTFSNKKPLKNNVAYNPTRISLEENTDGFHIHLRNYKLLLDKTSFLNFAKAAKEVLDVRERQINLKETLELIEINELHHTVSSIDKDGITDVASIVIQKPYYKKLLQLFDGLGYKKTNPAIELYEIAGARILLTIVQESPKPLPKLPVPTSVVPLAAYLAENAKRFNSKEINLLKLQVMDYFEYTKKNKLDQIVELSHERLLFDTKRNKVIFPIKTEGKSSNANQEWSRFDRFLNKYLIGFVKPNKIEYNESQLSRLNDCFREYAREHVSRHPCVKRIFLLNPIEWKKARSKTGRYEVPFLHIAWAKLGSDFDILIEVDERYPIPESWDFKFFWKVCGCDYYHLGEVDFPIDNPYAKDFPNIPFRQHLVEAYLFFPSRMDPSVKDKYLNGFPSREIIYEKKEVVEQLPSFIKQYYGIDLESVTPIKGVGFNEVFHATSKSGDYVVKVMKGAEFTPPAKGYRGKHLQYENSLLLQLSKLKAPVIIPKLSVSNSLYVPFGEFNCMLLDFVSADSVHVLALEHVRAAAKTLAIVNKALPAEVATTEGYRFQESLEFWLHDYAALPSKFTDDETIRKHFESLIPAIDKTRQRLLGATDIPWIHCHGDVTPRNMMFVKGQALLYDFQAARYSPRIEDVAEGALEFAFIDKQSIVDDERVDAFVQAYDAEYPLMERERSLLPSMMFLHAAVKLGRLLRMQVVFGNKVNNNYVMAFLSYALANAKKV